jgi:hypothetical protein
MSWDDGWWWLHQRGCGQLWPTAGVIDVLGGGGERMGIHYWQWEWLANVIVIMQHDESAFQQFIQISKFTHNQLQDSRDSMASLSFAHFPELISI